MTAIRASPKLARLHPATMEPLRDRHATIPIGPPLRAPAAVAEPLVLSMPSVAMRLVSDDEAINPTRPGRFTAITIRLEEAL